MTVRPGSTPGLEAERQAKAELEENARALEERKTDARREARELLDKAAAADAERSAAAYAEARGRPQSLQEQGERSLKERNARERRSSRRVSRSLPGRCWRPVCLGQEE